MAKQGNIGVTSENIFPIIKKFLYSDHEIFLRELVSTRRSSDLVDATQKLKTLASVGEFKGELGDLTVHVSFDSNTIKISDRGIGMTAEEIDKYINQIAFSGAEEFVEKYKNDAAAIIGHFGLGFYSSFMVSKKVEIVTKSYKEGAVPMKWSCDGTPEYTLEETEKEDRGTDIILYIDDENKDFLNKDKINSLLTKYCRYLPVPIAFGKKQEWKDGKYVDTDEDNIINDIQPAWVRKPTDMTDEDYKKFIKDNEYWIGEYAEYMSEKKSKFPESYFCFCQYYFHKQWLALKKYANDKGIQIVGDLPFYVALDGTAFTYHKELFKVDEEGKATVVGGCPPDAFAEDGQVWSNPVYDWEYHKKTDYEWWMKRLRHNFMLYDILRLDHFRGFDEYFEIPAEDETAVNGEWVKGPGMDFFEAMKKELGEKKVIAENLGFLTDSVHKLLDDTGFPGMNVLEFAFGAYDDSIYLPHKYKENSVVYTGTHDNDTVVGWYETLSEDDKKFLEHYLKYSTIERTGTVHLDLISLALESRSDMVIIPLQDYLGLGNEARINTPSTVGGNWEWRVKEEQLTDELKELIRTLTIKYRTVAEENAKKAAEEAQQ